MLNVCEILWTRTAKKEDLARRQNNQAEDFPIHNFMKFLNAPINLLFYSWIYKKSLLLPSSILLELIFDAMYSTFNPG